MSTYNPIKHLKMDVLLNPYCFRYYSPGGADWSNYSHSHQWFFLFFINLYIFMIDYSVLGLRLIVYTEFKIKQ